MWSWREAQQDKMPTCIDAQDLTVNIPVRIDSPDRLRNLVSCTNFLIRHTNARVLVGIGDSSLVRAHLDPRVDIVEVFDPPHGLFHRTRVLNELAQHSHTAFIANLDCDVIIPLEQLEQSLTALREQQAELVYPYDGMMMGIPFGYHPWLERADFHSLPTTLQRVMHPESLGGCMLWNRQAFLNIGMENEHLISWGFDDDERHARAQILGLRIHRIDGCIYHLDHSRGIDSSPTNPQANNNQREFERISQMTPDELSQEISRWSWSKSDTTSSTHILIWNDPWHRMSYFTHTADSAYQVSRSRQDVGSAHIIVVPIPVTTAESIIELRKVLRGHQKIVGFCRESLDGQPHFENIASQCDALMTYELSSDFPVPYLVDHDFSDLPAIQPLSSRRSPLVSAWVSSPHETSGRTAILNELMSKLAIDSYGHISNNRSLEDDHGASTKLATIANYRFTLAFENTISTDYVTEKFFEPLFVGSVPIYLGAPNVDSFAPGDHCFINVNDFASVAGLAEYISMMSDDEYLTFHQWRTQPLRPSFLQNRRYNSESPFTRLAHWHQQQFDAGIAHVAMPAHQ